MDFEKILSTILDVQKPWFIREVDVHKGTKSVNVFIDFERGAKFGCPNCGEMSKVQDSSYRAWRHLDVINYRYYLNIKMPRIRCYKHNVLAIDYIPWGRSNIHFTHLFEQ